MITEHRRSALWALPLGILVALSLTGCSAEEATFPDGSMAVIASSDIGTGPSRLLVGVVAADGQRLGSPDDRVAFEVAPADHPEQTQTADATWTWIFEPAIGLWRADVDVPIEGQWLVRVVPDAGPPTAPAAFTVRSETIAPDVGDVAPSPDTPTLLDTPLEALTTDPDPDERFYRSSLADVVASGQGAVAVFSTPAYCVSAACGPLLNIAKEVAGDYPAVEFVHVEVYTGFDEPGFSPGPESLAPSLGPDYWNLPTEPWVFVIADGRVNARFEGVMAPEELRSALDNV